MNKYKLTYEKTFSNRCVSKKIESIVILESELDLKNKSDICQLANLKLKQDNPEFFISNFDQVSSAWSEPKIKEIIILKE